MREWQTAKVWLLKELTSGNPTRND
jgi:hypothetical protein